jgi:hypothetical protein
MKAPRLPTIFLALYLLTPLPRCQAGPLGREVNDGVLHMLAGASSALLVSAAAYPLVDLGSDRRSALLVAGLGVCGALAAGATKELLDLGGRGDPEWSDLLMTLGGGLLAGCLVYLLTSLEPGTEEGNAGISAAYCAFALTLALPVGESLCRRL